MENKTNHMPPQPSGNIQKAIEAYIKLENKTKNKEREINLYFYNEYIRQQKENFCKLLNFIMEHIVNDLNSAGGIITDPIRLEARIKSIDSSFNNDAKARNPDDPPLKKGEKEKSSDLSDIFGITFVYSGDEVDDKTLQKSAKTGKPFTKTERNIEIENLIISKISSLFSIHKDSRLESDNSNSDLPQLKRKFNADTGYDSLHGTAHLKSEFEHFIVEEDDPEMLNLIREYIPLIEFHITESKNHKLASSDFYHILKFASPEDQSNFNRAKENKNTQKMNEIMTRVKQELQEAFNRKGYDFIPETSIPEMYISTESGEIRQLPKEGLHGSIKKLFYFLDISKQEFKDGIKVNLAPTNGTTSKQDSPSIQVQKKHPVTSDKGNEIVE